MAKPTLPRPTDGELSILRVLWGRGPSTVRQVHEILSRDRPGAYTTTLKLLQIMTEKGLVRRDDSDRSHVYQARMTEGQTQRQLVRDLLDRAFGGSATKLVVQALAARRSTPEELGEIRRLLEGRRQGRRHPDFHPDETGNAPAARPPTKRSRRRTMTMIELFMRQPMAQAIGWALLQFVWQGAVLGMLTAVVLAFLRRSASDIRYVVSTIGLALMLTMPIVTAWQSLEGSRPRRAAATAETNGVAAPAMPSAISTRGPAVAAGDPGRNHVAATRGAG